MIPSFSIQFISLIFVALFLFSPAENGITSTQFDTNKHPQPEHYPYKPNEVIHLDIADFAIQANDADTQNIINKLKQAQLADSIGVLEGEAHETLGRIVGVETDAAGRTYLLDQENSVIRVYDKSGNFLTSIGSAGQGPGEFFSPKFLALNDAGQVFVLDARGVISQFDNADYNFAYLQNIQQENMDFGEGIAVFNDKIVARGLQVVSPTESYIVKSVDLTSNEATYFGDGYNAGGYAIQFYLSATGPIEKVGNTAVFAVNNLPFVMAFTPTGEKKWVLQLDHFDPFPYFSDGDGIQMKAPENRFDRIENIQQVDETHLLLQLMALEDIKTPPSYQSWLINVETGAGSFISNNLPVIKSITNEGYFTLSELDYPRVDYYQFQD